MAKYDLEAMINYVLAKTGQSELYYLAHSMGAMTAFAKFGDDVKFSRKVKDHQMAKFYFAKNRYGTYIYMHLL